MDPVTVGLDIGSSALRAAEIEVGKDGRRLLRRYAQVGLAPGGVVDGEIADLPAVSEALRRLWAQGGFSTTKVVLGVSGPRVFVRQAEVPAMRAEDMRSALRFDAQELVPIPMEKASFDFSPLDGPAGPGTDSEPMQRILLVAAPQDLLASYSAALDAAGLEATVMDAAPLALMRAVPCVPSGDGGQPPLEVLVSVGAELTTVAVRQAATPRFIRSLGVGGARLTEGIANALQVEVGVAERLKRGGLPDGTPRLAEARKVMAADMREVAEEIRTTIDFFMLQSGDEPIGRLLITGGAAQTEDLAHLVADGLAVPLARLDPLHGLDVGALGYEPEDLERVRGSAATAVGLALWPVEAPLIRLNLLPQEVRERRKVRRIRTAAVAGVTAVAGVLVVAGAGQVATVHSAQQEARSAQAEVTSLNAQVARLQARTAAHTQVESRKALLAATLAGDVDWVRVVGQLATVMPPQLAITNLSATRSTTPTAGAAAVGAGTLNMSVAGTGGLPAVAAWLEGLGSDPDVAGTTVSGISVKANGGPVTFSSSAQLTPTSVSNRAQEMKR